MGSLSRSFHRGLAELAAYVKAHGDARVPWQHTTSNGFRLGSRCNTRRMDRKAGELTVERIAALDALGFVWDARQEGSERPRVDSSCASLRMLSTAARVRRASASSVAMTETGGDRNRQST